jgi:T5SS/PEP-CTERM-associated repeat protein
MHLSTGRPTARLSTVAAGVFLALTAPLAQAQFSSTGATYVYPGNAAVPSGAGPADLGNVGLQVGSGAAGSFSALGGSVLRVGSLLLGGGNSAANVDGTVLLAGVGTIVNLVGDGFSTGVVNRLGVGEWGQGSLTVSGGAVLNGRAEATNCLGQFHYCNNFIGNAAGSTGVFTVTGAGSQASFLRTFGVGNLAVFHPPIDAFTFGTPSGTTRGTVNVLDGGLLVTDTVTLGYGPGGGSPNGNERSFADATINGVGSLWRVTGGTLEPGNYARLNTATHRNSWATLNVTGGGEVRLEGDGNGYTILGLSTGGGRTDMLVSGAGSRVHFTGASGIFNIGVSAFGVASVEMRDGALADGMFYTGVGRNGGVASLLVDGAGTVMRIDGTATAAANGNSGPAYMEIGRDGGNGTATVSNGGRIEVLATQGFNTQGGSIVTGAGLGRAANSSGTLNINSGGVVLFRSTSSASGTAGETANPSVLIGREGNGTLNISGGGKLLLEGGAASTSANRRSTNLYVGGLSDTATGGKGIATVTGVGSEIRITGQDTFLGVGIGPQSNGQLTVSAGATVNGMGTAIGRSGGVGVLKVDNASLNFSGQQSAGNQSGAFFVIGSGGGIGVATLANGSVVNLTNMGSAGAGG